MENSTHCPPKSKYRSTIDQPILLLSKYLKKMKTLEGYTQVYICRSIIYSCQAMGATQVSINKWLNREEVVCMYKYTHTEEHYLTIEKRSCHLQ